MKEFFRTIFPFSMLYQKQQMLTLPQPLPIHPVFELPETGEYLYNPEYFASQATTEEIRQRFNALAMYQRTPEGSPPQWFVVFQDGLEINAGQLARYWAIYPEETYPGVAIRFGVNVIAGERMMKEVKRGAVGVS